MEDIDKPKKGKKESTKLDFNYKDIDDQKLSLDQKQLIKKLVSEISNRWKTRDNTN